MVEMEEIPHILSRLSLADDQDRVNILQGMLPALSASSRDEIQHQLRSANLSALFDCFNTSVAAEIEAAAQILDKVLNQLEPEFILESYSAQLVRGCAHPAGTVKLATLRQLQRCADDAAAASRRLADNHGLLVAATRLVADADLGVAKLAQLLLASLAATQPDRAVFATQPVLPILRELSASKRDVIRFRVHELTMKIAELSTEHLGRCRSAGLLDGLMLELSKDDVLVQLNAVELLSSLAMHGHGLEYLNSTGVLDKMDGLLVDAASDPMAAGLLAPGVVKFFGSVAHFRPAETLAGRPGLTSTLASALADGGPPAETAIALETLGVIGRSGAGKRALVDALGPPRLDGCVRAWARAVAGGNDANLHVRAIEAFAEFIGLNESERQDVQLLELTQSLFEQLSTHMTASRSGTAMSLLFALCKQPFENVREAVLGLLVALSEQPWSHGRFQAEPALLEFLLNRDAAQSKAAKECTFAVIRNLASLGPDPVGTFGTPVLIRMKEHVRDGPFHVRAQAQVAYGEQS